MQIINAQCPNPLTGIQLGFFVRNVTTCPQGPQWSCATAVGAEYNIGTGHNEVFQYQIQLYATDFQDNAFYRHLVNHETGHALGLKDGGPRAQDPGPMPCQQSIMHDEAYDNPDPFGCLTNLDYPSSFDRVSVSEMIPVGSKLGRSLSFFGGFPLNP